MYKIENMISYRVVNSTKYAVEGASDSYMLTELRNRARHLSSRHFQIPIYDGINGALLDNET